MPLALDIVESIVETTAPTEEAVTLAEVKAHCRIDIDDDDTWLTNRIVAARKFLEPYLRLAFVNTTLTYYADQFPPNDGPILLQRSPLSSVTSVKYVDTDGTLQTLDSSDYQVDTYSKPGRIVPAYDESWPSTRWRQINAVQIEFIAGYGADASYVPDDVKEAVMQTVALSYKEREQSIESLLNTNPRYRDILDALRVFRH